jgi:hypothetical protein
MPFLKAGGPGIYHIPEDIDAEDLNMIISKDRSGISAGPRSLVWLARFSIRRDWYGMEQDALVHHTG